MHAYFQEWSEAQPLLRDERQQDDHGFRGDFKELQILQKTS